MANSRNVLGSIPATFEHISQFAAGQAGQVVPIRMDLDTNTTDVGIFAPQPDSFVALMGWQYAKQLAHIINFYSSNITFNIDGIHTDSVANKTLLTTFEMNSGNGVTKELNGFPIIISEKGKGLSITTSAEPISMLLYIVEFKQFKF